MNPIRKWRINRRIKKADERKNKLNGMGIHELVDYCNDMEDTKYFSAAMGDLVSSMMVAYNLSLEDTFDRIVSEFSIYSGSTALWLWTDAPLILKNYMDYRTLTLGVESEAVFSQMNFRGRSIVMRFKEQLENSQPCCNDSCKVEEGEQDGQNKGQVGT